MQFFTVTLTVKAPFLTQKTGAIAVYLDAQPLLNKDRKPVIPGSLVKGNFYDVLKYAGINEYQLFDLETPKIEKKDTDNKRRRLIHFDTDWVCTTENIQYDFEQTISINEQTGAVSDGGLIFAQVISAPEELTFVGKIYVTQSLAETQLEAISQRLSRAFSAITAIGSNKKIGFGNILTLVNKDEKNLTLKGAEVVPEMTNTNKAIQLPDLSNYHDIISLGLTLLPQWAMCFVKTSRHRIDTVETEHFIPGGAIKGAWFEALKANGVLASDTAWKLLDKATVTHALFSNNGRTDHPTEPPMTLAKITTKEKQTEKCADLWADLWDDEQKFDPNEKYSIEGIFFASDWKDKERDKVNKNFGLTSPLTDLRVRHQYDQMIRASKEGNLFLEETLSAYQDGNWHCNIHFVSEGYTEKAFQEALQKLFNAVEKGLPCVGRKATPIVITAIDKLYPLSKKPKKPKKDNCLRITLQTPARLFGEKQIVSLSDKNNLLYSIDTLKDIYQDSFQQLFETENKQISIILQDFAANQILVGGNRWAKHLGENYSPEVFTDKGSTFLISFDTKDAEDIKNIVSRWQRLGLPQLSDRSEEKFINPFSKDNKACPNDNPITTPWTRRNGFGQVAIAINTAGEPS